MELFAKLFDSLLVFVYHCFDRIVIHGYLSGLSRPEQVVYFFRQVLGIPVVDKEVLSRRTNDYQRLGGGLCPQPQNPHGVGRKGSPQRGLRAARAAPHGEAERFMASTSSSKAWNRAAPSASAVPKFPTQDPNYRILASPAQPLHPLLLLHPG